MPEGLPIHVDDVAAHRWDYGEVGATRRRLGVAAGAKRLGVAIIEIDPGRRSTPSHSHADEDEAFLGLAGAGLSYQSSGPGDARTYAIGVDDVLWHPANGDAAGPLELPEPTAERPPTIRNLAHLPLHEGREGRLAYATRDLRDMGSDKLVLAQDAMPPDTHNTDLHFHSAREEAWYVRHGGGIARLGEDGHELRPGSFWLCRENTGVGHRIEVGPEGMQLVTMGDLIPGDVCVYPEKRTFKPARGLELPY